MREEDENARKIGASKVREVKKRRSDIGEHNAGNRAQFLVSGYQW